MASEASGDTSGSDGDHCYTSDASGGAFRGEGGGESVSGVTEVGSSSGNAVAGKARRWGGGEDRLSRLTMEGEGEVDDSAGDEEEEKASAGECVAAYSPVWLLAARLGWLVLGFLAGAAVAATALFHKHDGYPESCTVPT